jgi:3-hydroxyacyl-CoA dehydrogenase
MAAQHGSAGMVGTGNMGGRMTRRMTGAGYHVLAVDLDPARIPACGATPAKDLALRSAPLRSPPAALAADQGTHRKRTSITPAPPVPDHTA